MTGIRKEACNDHLEVTVEPRHTSTHLLICHLLPEQPSFTEVVVGNTGVLLGPTGSK